MMIESIRLHPFGGITDRTVRFTSGLNVLEGPNEAGKSTLCQALFHALFTPTDLTRAKLQRTMGRFLPRPNGDHARVTLVFMENGIRHTLIRRWGAKAGTELVLEGRPPMADTKSVQEMLAQALRWNEATWEHVLFIDQAKLNDTLHLLEQGEHNDIGEILRNSGKIDGDIAPEKLIAALEARIDELYSNWDRRFSRPRDGRGIEDPHKRNVGPVLKAFYEQELLRKQHETVLRYEREVDAVHAEIARVREQLEKHQQFVEDGRKRKDGLHRRSLIEQGLKHRQDGIERLMKVMAEWPGAERIVKEKKQAIQRCEEDLVKLKSEIANAKKHQDGEKHRSMYRTIIEAKRTLDEARAELAKTRPVTKEQVDKLRALVLKVEKIEVEIKAQKLAAVVETSGAVSVRVEAGGSPPEGIDLSAGESRTFTAEGKIAFHLGEVRIGVRSDQKDVEQLYTDLTAAKAEQAEFLKDSQCVDLPALIARKEAHDLVQRKVERSLAAYSASLQNRTEEQWKQYIDELAAIPAARALGDLEQERERILGERARHEQEEKNLSKNIIDWTREHGSVDQLMLKVVDLRTQQGQEEAALKDLPTVPEGFNDAATYLAMLHKAEGLYQQAQEAMHQALLQQSNLAGRIPERTAEELKEELDLKQRRFQRQLNEAKAYERILLRVRSLADREGPDPLAGLTARVAHFVNILTDGRYRPRMEGAQAVGLIGGHLLENDLLSQGTKGSLALAVRMAYAEVYLSRAEGSMIMDDPLTDMDPERRRCAVKAIADFARDHQVIVLTCHPEHAALFAEYGVQVREIGNSTKKAIA